MATPSTGTVPSSRALSTVTTRSAVLARLPKCPSEKRSADGGAMNVATKASSTNASLSVLPMFAFRHRCVSFFGSPSSRPPPVWPGRAALCRSAVVQGWLRIAAQAPLLPLRTPRVPPFPAPPGGKCRVPVGFHRLETLRPVRSGHARRREQGPHLTASFRTEAAHYPFCEAPGHLVLAEGPRSSCDQVRARPSATYFRPLRPASRASHARATCTPGKDRNTASGEPRGWYEENGPDQLSAGLNPLEPHSANRVNSRQNPSENAKLG